VIIDKIITRYYIGNWPNKTSSYETRDEYAV